MGSRLLVPGFRSGCAIALLTIETLSAVCHMFSRSLRLY